MKSIKQIEGDDIITHEPAYSVLLRRNGHRLLEWDVKRTEAVFVHEASGDETNEFEDRVRE
jgi:hypothetical protein